MLPSYGDGEDSSASKNVKTELNADLENVGSGEALEQRQEANSSSRSSSSNLGLQNAVNAGFAVPFNVVIGGNASHSFVRNEGMQKMSLSKCADKCSERCSVCRDLCKSCCAQGDKSANKPLWHPRFAGIRRCLQTLVHSSTCHNNKCLNVRCYKMKIVMKHTRVCRRRNASTCPVCRQYLALCVLHFKTCTSHACPVHYCIRSRYIAQNIRAQERLLVAAPAASSSASEMNNSELEDVGPLEPAAPSQEE